MAGLVPAISLRRARAILIGIAGVGKRRDAVLRTALPGDDGKDYYAGAPDFTSLKMIESINA